jgi:uncharacterized membrane protein
MDSVDLLRGAIMIIMALDHVRDFWSDKLGFVDPTEMDKTTVPLFLTRWITHYCAPNFMFLAGTGAFLSRTRGKSKSELSWFLFSRGLWLVLLEVTFIRGTWMFNWDPIHHGAGVFWAIGWSMVVLSVLVYLPLWAITTFGLVMICTHNLLDTVTPEQVHLPDWLWMILHYEGLKHDPTILTVPDNLWHSLHSTYHPPFDDVGYVTFGTNYHVIPWCGVMAAGYGFGRLLLLDQSTRRRMLLTLGTVLTLAFVVVRFINQYGDPWHWEVQSRGFEYTVCSFLNCTKYPPSLCYLLMTIGPAIIFLGIFDRPLGALAKPVITFGRVPLFFYFLHIPLIHGGIVAYDHLRYGWSPQSFNGPWAVDPAFHDFLKQQGLPPYGVNLLTVYLLWICAIVILYFPCRWFAGVKQRNRSVWLSYL